VRKRTEWWCWEQKKFLSLRRGIGGWGLGSTCASLILPDSAYHSIAQSGLATITTIATIKFVISPIMIVKYFN
jgi:hypothetical protein